MPTSRSNILTNVLLHGPSAAWTSAFDALMSMDDKPDLQETIDLVKQEEWPDEFRYGLEGLQTFREYYGDRMEDFTPDQRATINRYDEEWSLDLLDQLHKRKYGVAPDEAPEPVIE